MRDTFVVAGLAVVAVAVGSAVFWYGKDAASAPGTDGQTASAIVPFEKIVSGTDSPVKERKNYLITSSIQLGELWEILGQEGNPPAIDFQKQAVVAVFAGQKPTSGYAISVSKVQDNGKRTVWVSVAEPEEDCVVAQSITAPYEVVMLPATDLSFGHEDVLEKVSCES